MRNKKLRKNGLCFITGYFTKLFKIIINHFFYFSSSFAAQLWLFFYIKDVRRGNWERQKARNNKLNIHLKNNFNLLVMNVT